MAKELKPWALVTGAGGFIGHHLVSYLKAAGYRVRGVDIKRPEYSGTDADEFMLLDLREQNNCQACTVGMDFVYHLAADMGGIGYITASHAGIAYNNSLMNLHMLEAARSNGVGRFLYSSSACVYPHGLQTSPDVTPLREEDAFPAEPEEGYGLEKLYAEKLCQYYMEDHGLSTRVVRFHNVYGPLGTYDGGREKAPAAMCAHRRRRLFTTAIVGAERAVDVVEANHARGKTMIFHVILAEFLRVELLESITFFRLCGKRILLAQRCDIRRGLQAMRIDAGGG